MQCSASGKTQERIKNYSKNRFFIFAVSEILFLFVPIENYMQAAEPVKPAVSAFQIIKKKLQPCGNE